MSLEQRVCVLEEQQQSISEAVERVDHKVDRLQVEMRQEFRAVREETRVQFQEMREETQAQFQEMREETQAQFQEMREETQSQLQAMREETQSQLQEMQAFNQQTQDLVRVIYFAVRHEEPPS